jgi:hypothetical protein
VLRIASSTLWPSIHDLADNGEGKHAAVAYVSSDKKIRFEGGDVLVTDASDPAIAGGQTSVSVLSRAHKAGAKLYSLAGLHAKVLCLGRHVVVGSANVSVNSVNGLIEAGVVSDSPALLAEARAFIGQLVDAATPIDRKFLRRIASIPVTRNAMSGQRRPKLADRASRTWLVGLREIDDERHPEEREWLKRGERTASSKVTADDSGVSWIRFTAQSKFRNDAQPGDSVIQVWRPNPGSSVLVYRAAPLLLRREEPKCTRFYVEAFSDEDARAVPWKKFVGMWKRSSDDKTPPVMCARLLRDDVAESLNALWPRANGR